jgi:hypothetical protein
MCCVQLYRATALIALVMIVVLSAGYAATERSEQEQDFSRTASQDSRS